MFASAYQTGEAGIEVITAAGKAPTTRLIKQPHVPKEYDRDIKGYKFVLGQQNTVQCPAASGRDTLGLLQPLLVFQLRCPHEDDMLNLEIVVLDTDHQRRRFHFSTTFRSLEPHALHVQIPWVPTEKTTWTNVVFSLDNLVAHFFRTKYLSVDSFHLRPTCYLRKVFTLPQTALRMVDGQVVGVPASFEFPSSASSTAFLFPSTTDGIKAAMKTPKYPAAAAPDTATSRIPDSGLLVAGQKISSKSAPRCTDSSPARSQMQSQSQSLQKGSELSSQPLPQQTRTNVSPGLKRSEVLSNAGKATVGSLVPPGLPTRSEGTNTNTNTSTNTNTNTNTNTSKSHRLRDPSSGQDPADAVAAGAAVAHTAAEEDELSRILGVVFAQPAPVQGAVNAVHQGARRGSPSLGRRPEVGGAAVSVAAPADAETVAVTAAGAEAARSSFATPPSSSSGSSRSRSERGHLQDRGTDAATTLFTSMHHVQPPSSSPSPSLLPMSLPLPPPLAADEPTMTARPPPVATTVAAVAVTAVAVAVTSSLSSCDDSCCLSPADKENATSRSTSAHSGTSPAEKICTATSPGASSPTPQPQALSVPASVPAPVPLPVLLTRLEEMQLHLSEEEMAFIEEFGASAFSNI